MVHSASGAGSEDMATSGPIMAAAACALAAAAVQACGDPTSEEDAAKGRAGEGVSWRAWGEAAVAARRADGRGGVGLRVCSLDTAPRASEVHSPVTKGGAGGGEDGGSDGCAVLDRAERGGGGGGVGGSWPEAASEPELWYMELGQMPAPRSSG